MNAGVSALPQDVEAVSGADEVAVPGLVETLPVFKPSVISINHRKGAGLPEHGGGTLAYETGYTDGQVARKRGEATSTYLLVGRDEYCLGFRAGYFASDRTSLRGANGPAGKEQSC